MLTLRKAEERGHFDHGWLDTHHSFSFASYFDPEHMGFRSLRVINEDRILPGQGFGTHSHRDMEILTYVFEGSLEHRDDIGNGSVIQTGDFQRMSAGTGIQHSEFNSSRTVPTRLLQIWIQPAEKGLPPSYEQRSFPIEERRNKLRIIASPSGRDGSLMIHQDAEIYSLLLGAGQRTEHHLHAGRHAWIQVVSGALSVNGAKLSAGDGLGVTALERVTLSTDDDAEILLFDLS